MKNKKKDEKKKVIKGLHDKTYCSGIPKNEESPHSPQVDGK